MATTSPVLRILLVEDDPVSQTFLQAALQALPAEVHAAATGADAAALAMRQRHDAWLIDANLPDCSGADLLARLRRDDARALALAHTATEDPEALAALRRAGFSDVLVKPLPASAVREALRRVLDGRDRPQDPEAADADTGAWDDEAAARALNGNREHIAALRALFVAELPAVRERLVRAANDGNAQQVQDELHRLRASCGFVGAARLGAAVSGLHAMPSAERLRDVEEAIEATLASVGQAPVPA